MFHCNISKVRLNSGVLFALAPTHFFAQAVVKRVRRQPHEPRLQVGATNAHAVAAVQWNTDLAVYREHRFQFSGRDFLALPFRQNLDVLVLPDDQRTLCQGMRAYRAQQEKRNIGMHNRTARGQRIRCGAGRR